MQYTKGPTAEGIHCMHTVTTSWAGRSSEGDRKIQGVAYCGGNYRRMPVTRLHKKRRVGCCTALSTTGQSSRMVLYQAEQLLMAGPGVHGSRHLAAI